MGELEGKTIAVTGAGSGIGRASALRFARAGARVGLLDIDDSVQAVAAAIRADSGQCIVLEGDAAEPQRLEALLDGCVDGLGGLDGVFANAGVRGAGVPFDELSAEQFLGTLRVNLIGPFLAAKYAVPRLRPGGAILCTASVAGLRAGAGGVDYSASKAGVISLVQTLAQQLAGSGIRINAVCPGLIETGMTAPLFERARTRGTEDRIGQLNPLRRAGEPEEIAAMAAFLLSDAASYVNGQAIAVDGGLSSSHPIVPPRVGTT